MEINLKEIISNSQITKDKNEVNEKQNFDSIDKKQKDLEKEHLNNNKFQKTNEDDSHEKNKISNNDQKILKKEIEHKLKLADSFDMEEYNSILLNNESYLNNTFGQSIDEKIEINCGEERGKTFDLCKCKCIVF